MQYWDTWSEDTGLDNIQKYILPLNENKKSWENARKNMKWQACMLRFWKGKGTKAFSPR